jgi:lysyl-tRNA synthetase class 2
MMDNNLMGESGEYPVSAEEIFKQRLANLEAIKNGKLYAGSFHADGAIANLLEIFEENKKIQCAGRLTAIRHMGKSTFADLRDATGRIQIFAGKAQTADYELFRKLDLADIIGVDGVFFITKAGEKTIRVHNWCLISKALRPLPEKWHGLKDVDIRYRQRYLDIIANDETRRIFAQRHEIIKEVRQFLWGRGFQEVETPMLQPQAGGAAAKPFITHYAALDAKMYLRIAPELYLKRLLVAGYNKIFELNRNFRNEGLSKKHNPEFTMLEIYEAYSDRKGMQKLVEELIVNVAKKVIGKLQIEIEKTDGTRALLDLTPPWQERTYDELIKETAGNDWFQMDISEAKKRATQMGLVIDEKWNKDLITHEIYEKLIEKNIFQPTFVTRFPSSLVPLAKACADNPERVDVYELVIAGKEISPGYSELNEALEQRKRFQQQVGEDAEKIDEDFLEALEHGMPSAGGMGVGIDRLVMILTGVDTIRDVILFPQLKPKSSKETEKSEEKL